MSNVTHELPSFGMPPEVVRTVKILAPDGSSIEQVETALRVASLHHSAIEEKRKEATLKLAREIK